MRFLHCLSCSCSFGIEIVILGGYSSDFGLVGILSQIKKPCFWKLINNQTWFLIYYFCVCVFLYSSSLYLVSFLFSLVGYSGASSSMSFKTIHNINSFALIIGVTKNTREVSLTYADKILNFCLKKTTSCSSRTK